MSAFQLEQAIQNCDENAALICIASCPEVVNSVLPRSQRLPLNLAIAQKLSRVVVAILQAGANPNEDSQDGPPLCEAISTGQAEMAVHILQAGADPSRHKGNFTIPHCIAFRAGLLPEGPARYLLSAALNSNVDLNAQTELGTPLHSVFDNDSSWIVTMLCRAGANPNAYNSRGMTPLYFYVSRGKHSLATAIIACGADTEMTKRGSDRTPLSVACINGSFLCAEALLHGGANPNAFSGGWPLLSYPVGDGNVDLVKLFIRFGVNVNLSDSQHGLTSLMVATRLGRLEVLVELLKAGARSELQDNTGRRAIDFIDEVADLEIRKAIVDALACAPRKENGQA